MITPRVANNLLQVIYNLKNQYSYDVTRKYLYYYYFEYFSLLSNTIYNMNSVEIMRNKPEIIWNKDRNYFLVISVKRPVKVETSNHCVSDRKAMQPAKRHTECMTGEGICWSRKFLMIAYIFIV